MTVNKISPYTKISKTPLKSIITMSGLSFYTISQDYCILLAVELVLTENVSKRNQHTNDYIISIFHH